MKNILILTLLVFLSFQSAKSVGQETGKIAGKIIDKKSGETLVSLIIRIDNSARYTVTDVEGRYTLTNLAPGKYALTFSYLGYQPKNITDIDVAAGKTTNLDVIMEESASQSLAEVVIRSTARLESVNGLYAQQKNSTSISSGIVADQIKRSPDRNTSEVLKRISGTSIQDGKFVIIRGLSDRYNVALINNSVMPSSEPDRRAFSFDIVPSNLIDRIVVSKTASPDLPGDFAGGVTQIITKDVPDDNYLNMAIAFGYNSQSTFKQFKSSERNTLDFLGFDNGNRAIPSGFPSSRQIYTPSSDADKIKYSKLVPNLYPEKSGTALPVQSYQINWGKVANFKSGGVLGSIVSLTYRNAQNYQDATREAFDGVNFAYQYKDNAYKFNSTIGALANFTYKKDKSKVSFKNIFNQTFDDSYTSRTGYSQNQNSDIRFNSSEVNQKSLISSQLEGNHGLGQKNLKLDWNLNYALIKRSQPDLRSIIYNRPLNTTSPFSLVDDFSRRFYSDLSENNFGGSASLILPFKLLKDNSSLKVGLQKQTRFREFNARVFLYEPTNTSQFDNSKLLLPKETVFAPANISESGFVLNEITNTSDSYDGFSDLNAGYIMLDNKFGDKVRLVWGSRLENYFQEISTLNTAGRRVYYDKAFIDVLPSFNLTYNLNDKTNIRLSGSGTVSRPELRELAPFTFINQEENSQITGNPKLLRSQNTNADLRFETYPAVGEAFTFTLFYKNFRDPIEQVVSSNATADVVRFGYLNAASAYSYGFEVDLRKKLSFLSPGTTWLQNLVASANFAYIKSEVDLNQTGQKARALQGQSPYLINAGLQYNTAEAGLTFSALYNKIGDRISKVGNTGSGFPDIYEKGRDVIDLQIAKRILKNKAEIKLNVSDLLNQSQVFYQNFDGNKVYNKNSDIDFYGYKAGTNISLGITYDFTSKK